MVSLRFREPDVCGEAKYGGCLSEAVGIGGLAGRTYGQTVSLSPFWCLSLEIESLEKSLGLEWGQSALRQEQHAPLHHT